jgi:type IV secretory pathway VirB10-like protein
MAVKEVKEEAARTLGKKPRDLMAHLDDPKIKGILAPDAIVRLRSELERAAKANEARRKRKAAKPEVDIQTPKAPEFILDGLPDLPSQPKQPKTQTVVDSSPIKKDEPESKRKRAFEAVDTAMARLDEAKIKYSFQFNGSA